MFNNLLFLDEIVKKLKEKPDWLYTSHKDEQNLADDTTNTETRSSIYNDPSNREDLHLPMPNHTLRFINDREASNPNRFKRLKCCSCKRNTHHYCETCAKAYCKDCAYKVHIMINPRFSEID